VINGMNHAVLYVRDARRQQRFFHDVLDFATVSEHPDGAFVFMRAPASVNHHDIAFFSIGDGAGDSSAGRGTVGMYHLAWEVATLDDLQRVQTRLGAAGALVGASDHGSSKSLYARDPDGLEFEVMWPVPEADWGDAAEQAVIQPLDLEREIRRFGADRRSSTRRERG
jgi:catechol-2,3-dioxygenase